MSEKEMPQYTIRELLDCLKVKTALYGELREAFYERAVVGEVNGWPGEPLKGDGLESFFLEEVKPRIKQEIDEIDKYYDRVMKLYEQLCELEDK